MSSGTDKTVPKHGTWSPIKLFGGKASDDYKYFANDFHPHRLIHWASIYLQCAPIAQREDVHSVLEFGSGRNLTKFIIEYLGISHTSVDVSDRFRPDYVSSILDFPFRERNYDLVCSFQCLEHNPLEQLDDLIAHMVQFTNRYLYISLPYAGSWFSFSFNFRIPKVHFAANGCFASDIVGGRKIDDRPLRSRPPERFHSAHWWEVGRPGTRKKTVIAQFERHGLRLVDSYHNVFYPYHIFFLFEKTS